MRFMPTPLSGVVLVEFDPSEDERGSFCRTFCEDEFARAGIAMRPRQINLSQNRHARTLRGLHYQAPPHAESKLVHCLRGRVFDVVLDLRRGSPSYRRWFATELAPELRRMIFIPEGCAHGFLTLDESSELIYLMGSAYAPEAGRGVRWNDPAFAIRWPATPLVIAPRDAAYPDYRD